MATASVPPYEVLGLRLVVLVVLDPRSQVGRVGSFNSVDKLQTWAPKIFVGETEFSPRQLVQRCRLKLHTIVLRVGKLHVDAVGTLDTYMAYMVERKGV